MQTFTTLSEICKEQTNPSVEHFLKKKTNLEFCLGGQ